MSFSNHHGRPLLLRGNHDLSLRSLKTDFNTVDYHCGTLGSKSSATIVNILNFFIFRSKGYTIYLIRITKFYNISNNERFHVL